MSAAADSTPARRAYEAYSATVGGVAVNGDTLPPWDLLSNKVQEGWRSAAAEGSKAYHESDRAQRISAARQMVAQEGTDGPTERLARAFTDALNLLDEDGEAESWDDLDMDDQRNMRTMFALLIRGGHLHAGRPHNIVQGSAS